MENLIPEDYLLVDLESSFSNMEVVNRGCYEQMLGDFVILKN
jgi:hypothetical protein